jgi:hypothetical protein
MFAFQDTATTAGIIASGLFFSRALRRISLELTDCLFCSTRHGHPTAPQTIKTAVTK